MPITTDILAQLKKIQQPTSEAPSLFLKVPNSDLMSKVTRGNPDAPAPISVPQPADVTSSLGDVQRVDPTARPGQSLLDVLRTAGVRSPVTQTPEGVTEGAPTPMGHGFWNRLKKVGEGAVIGMGQQARLNAQSGRPQSLESLLGAGAAGGVVGGVNPISIDVLRRQNEIGQAESDQFRQGELDKQQAEAEGARQKPLIDLARVQQEAQRAQDAAARENARTDEIARHNRATEGKTPTTKVGTHVVGGKLVDDTGKVIYDSGPQADKVDIRQGEERQRKFDAAQRELGTLIEQEKNAASLKDQKATALTTLEAQDAAGDANMRATLKPQLDRARSEYENAQKFYEGFGAQKTKAQKAVDENAPTQAPPATGPIKPAKDGKYHYTTDQIRAAAGANFDKVYAQLKANPKVKIDE
jgi:hypothetical protein